MLKWSSIEFPSLARYWWISFSYASAILVCLPASSLRRMTQAPRALVSVSTFKRVDLLILEGTKQNTFATFSGMTRESFSSWEQMTPRPFLSNISRIQNAHRVHSCLLGEDFSFLVLGKQYLYHRCETCCDLKEIHRCIFAKHLYQVLLAKIDPESRLCIQLACAFLSTSQTALSWSWATLTNWWATIILLCCALPFQSKFLCFALMSEHAQVWTRCDHIACFGVVSVFDPI